MLAMGRSWHHFLLSIAIALCYDGSCRFTCAREVTISTTEGALAQSVKTFLFPAPQDPTTGTDGSIFRYDPTVKSPCSVEKMPSSGGVLVDCRNRNISRIDPRWFPANTTVLWLDSNNINRLENDTFFHLGLLKNLSICCSNMVDIQINALRGLKCLEYLNLESNKLRLKNKAFPKTMFVYTPNLHHLYIQYNGNMDYGTEYTSMDEKKDCSEVLPYSYYIDIFDLDLESLSIDIFPNVCVEEEFSRFQNLKNLQLSGPSFDDEYVFLTNDTFWGLRDVTLAHLSISYFKKPVITENGLFQHLHHLKSLAISSSHFGNHMIAKLMWPFVNKTMSFLHLNYTNYHWDLKTPDSALKDGIITNETLTEYIGQICVADFAWVDSGLFVIEVGALVSPTWRRCLKKVDFSGNNFDLVFWKVSLFDVVLLSALESATVTLAVPYTTYQIDGVILDESIKKENESLLTSEGSLALSHTNGVQEDVKTDKEINSSDYTDNYTSIDTYDATQSLKNHGTPVRRNVQVFSDPDFLQKHDISKSVQYINEGQLVLYFPRNLKRLRLRHVGVGWIIWGVLTIVFKGTDNLLELYVTYMPKLIGSQGRILGLEGLKLLDLSYSYVKVRQDFFDDFPGIEILVLRSIFPKNYFDRIIPCKQVIRKMSKLRYLDISNNGLLFLSPGTFSTNPDLKQIILSENRFSVVPFQLHLTPKLVALDLSYNAILYLDEGDRAAIEIQAAKVDTFYLKLEGNGLACVCSQMEFLAWLNRTAAILDKDGNYSCTSQDGWLSHTVSNSDLLGFWRQCSGWSCLMTSIVLALVLLVSFLTTYLTARFRCAIKAFMLRLMFPQFRPLTPQDYRTDVIVCYADDDFRFVRNILLGFLEDELQQRTHIHQRDLPVGGHIDDHIHQAIENSWRIMLVITETFLHRYDMADIMMKFACYAVGPANQGRVFAMVEHDQLNWIPNNLHAVLEDDRIIVIHNLNGPLGYEQKQSIKNCLRPNN